MWMNLWRARSGEKGSAARRGKAGFPSSGIVFLSFTREVANDIERLPIFRFCAIPGPVIGDAETIQSILRNSPFPAAASPLPAARIAAPPPAYAICR